MKRVIYGMGVNNPAHVVAPHNTFNPTIKLDEFKRLVKTSIQLNIPNLVNGVIEVVIQDIHADNAAGNVSNSDIRNYYRKFYNEVQNCALANACLVNRLANLV